MSEREFDKFLDILQRWHKDDYYTTADALGDARALFEAEHAKVSEPKLDTRAERAELQVSLLNEIGLTLTALAKEQVEQAETLKTYKLSLEGIQGLLVGLEHSLDVIAEVQANSYDAVVTKFEVIYKRLTPMENRMADLQLSVDAMRGPERGDTTGTIRGIEAHIGALALGMSRMIERLAERTVTVKRKPSLRPVSRKKRKR